MIDTTKISKGPVEVQDYRTNGGKRVVCHHNGYTGQIADLVTPDVDGKCACLSRDEIMANAHLTAEAFNTFHETGMTPAELGKVYKLAKAWHYAQSLWNTAMDSRYFYVITLYITLFIFYCRTRTANI